MSEYSGKLTAMQRLTQLRKEQEKRLAKEEKLSKKKKDKYERDQFGRVIFRDSELVKTKKKKVKKLLRKDLRKNWQYLTPLQKKRLISGFYDEADMTIDYKALKAEKKREKKEWKKRKRELAIELEHLPGKAEYLEAICEIIDKYDGNYRDKKASKRLRKQGFDEIGGQFVVNEKRLIKSVKRQSKEFAKAVDSFRNYLEEVMSSEAIHLKNLKNIRKNGTKKRLRRAEDFLDTFRDAANTSPYFRFS